jgi:ornithine cyclodeaminase
MIYLNEKDIRSVGINWKEAIKVIEEAVMCMGKKDFSQPVKPYLRYKNLENRIIAMPAYIGGSFDSAGIKWIASFPNNIKIGMSRANSVVILNNADTGEPLVVMNTPLLSAARTASVSGLIMKRYDEARRMQKFNLGIIGFGPIGQQHLNMFLYLYGDRIGKVFIYDIRDINLGSIESLYKDKIIVTGRWEDAYLNSDVVATCTVSKERYIDKRPKKGSLHLNISLRDYKANVFDKLEDVIVVDDWEEVCRENTDIEEMHKVKDLRKEDVKNIIDVVCRNVLETVRSDKVVMFNPMGMGIFDIALAKYYYELAGKKGIGVVLE